MATKQDEKHLKILRSLVQQPENKRCADCLAKGPVYANTNFHTFICTTCSGIHREFGFRVKSISMASFKPEEIKALQEGGNEVARQKWMARWSSSEQPEPDSGDLERIRSMIRHKYVEKRWYDERGKGNSKRDDLPRAEPLSNVLGNNIPPIRVENTPQNVPRQTPVQQQSPVSQQQQPPQQSRSNVVDFGAFDFQTSAPSAPTPVQTPFGTVQATPISPQQGNGLGDLIFPSSEEVQKKQQEEQQKLKAMQLQQALGQMYQQSAYQNQMLQQQYYMQQQMYQMQQMQQLQMQQQQQQQMGIQQQQSFPGVQANGIPPQNNPIPPQMYGVQSPVVQSNSWGVQSTPIQPSIPIEPEKPAKPDPFAALSPFTMSKGTPLMSSPTPKPTTTTVSNNSLDPFGDLGSPSKPVTASSDPFGLGGVESQPYGISQTNHVPTPVTNNDFNPFF